MLGPLYAVSFMADGERLLYGGEDRVLRSVSISGAEPPHDIHEFPPVRDARPEIEAIAPVSDATAAVACGATIAIIDIKGKRLLRELDPAIVKVQPPVIHGLAASPDGSMLVAAGSDRIPRIWDIASGKAVAAFPSHPNWIYACRFSPDGHSIVTACRDGVAKPNSVVMWAASGTSPSTAGVSRSPQARRVLCDDGIGSTIHRPPACGRCQWPVPRSR